MNSEIFVTGVSREKGSEQNLDHRSLNLVVLGIHSISRTVLKGWILFQIMVDMLTMDARRLSHRCHRIVNVASTDRPNSIVGGIAAEN